MIASNDIKAQFAEQGFCLAPGVFSGDELAALQFDFDRIVSQLLASGENANARWNGAEVEKLGASDTVVFHTHNVQQYSGAWTRAFMSPKFLEAAQAIVGPNVMLHHSKLFQKPAENGAPFPMHQDWEYFPTLKDTMMAAIIHLSDATDAMGCLRVYPGTHKLGRMSAAMGQGALSDDPIEKATPIEAKAGDVLFFHYFTIHGSMPNRSDKVRKTVLVQMHSGDYAVEAGNQHPNARLCLSGWNHHASRSSANMD